MKLRMGLAVLCALATTGGTASAATLTVDTEDASPDTATFTFTGSPGEASNLILTTAANSITFTESAGVIVVLPDTTSPNPELANCPVPLGLSVTCTFATDPKNTSVILNMGDANDKVSFEGSGGPMVTAFGQDGNDTLGGGTGVGGELVGGKGADVFAPNIGSTVSYRGSSAPVFVTVDGVADDGLSGEGDNVKPGFTSYVLGLSDDEFSGGILGETIAGGGGLDSIYGAGGNDVITANDRLTGGPGDDRLISGNRVDVLDGGSGNDYMSAGLGADTLNGGDGADEMYPSDGADVVNGGPGDDYVRVPKDGAFDQIDCGSETDKADWATALEPADVYLNCEEIF